uniref:uncharacterized protein n=1 Tax=Myxine glutinosa TaxID=7769 RepID=UPI00358E72B9
MDTLSRCRFLCDTGAQHGLIINPAKCRFGVATIDFLGYRITVHGAVPLPAKVEAVRAFPRPRMIKGLQEFLGMVNFHHRFVHHIARLLCPLHEALQGKPGKGDIAWSEPMATAFTGAKLALADATMLAHPAPDAPIALITDVSDYAQGQPYVVQLRDIDATQNQWSEDER